MNSQLSFLTPNHRETGDGTGQSVKKGCDPTSDLPISGNLKVYRGGPIE